MHWIGLAGAVLLIAACFMPWVYHGDINETSTGFHSVKNNYYGRPGKFLAGAAVLFIIFTLLPKLLAKRINLFLTALTLAYAVTKYVIFSSCYNAYCPEKKIGLYCMVAGAALMLLSAIFPKMEIPGGRKTVN